MQKNSTFKLSFIGTNGKEALESAFLTWTPTKLRISRSNNEKVEQIILNQEYLVGARPVFPSNIDTSKLSTPTILFYADYSPMSTGELSYTIQFEEGENFKEIFVGGMYQADKLFHGASPEQKDIRINASHLGDNVASILTMIRVRKNANQLSKKAKNDYLEALSTINKRDAEGRGVGIYSTDFFKMHVKGSKSIAHGTEVFLPWHRLYILDLERQLQAVNPLVSLHYWKFDEPAPNIFSADFLGESIVDKADNPIMTDGVSTSFARFSDDNPLISWAIDREKLIRRMSWFDNQSEQAGFNEQDPDTKEVSFYAVQKEKDTYLNKVRLYSPTKDGKAFTVLEGDPHGYTHVSNNGFINYVPTAPKDPIFFFLHSNVERMWGKWQTMRNLFEPTSVDNYPNQGASLDSGDWRNVNAALWPWNGRVTPNDFHLEAPVTRANNFTLSDMVVNFKDNSPIIKDALDPFGLIDYAHYLGFEYDDTASFSNSYSLESGENQELLTNKLQNATLQILHKEQDVQDLIGKMEALLSNNKQEGKEGNQLLTTSSKSTELRSILNTLTLNRVFSSELPKLSASVNHSLEKLLAVATHTEEIDAILIPLVYADNRDIIHQLELNFQTLEVDVTSSVSIRYYDESSERYETKAFSKYLVVYLLALYDYEYIQDDKIYELIDKNKNLFDLIDQEIYLDLFIALLTFSSNTVIKKVNRTLAPANFLYDLNQKVNSPIHNKLNNKYWALYVLFTYAIDN